MAVKKKNFNLQVVRQVDEFKERSEIRYRIAKAAFDAQDEKTRGVILAIQDQLMLGATGTIRVFPDGVGHSVAVKVEFEYIEYNTLYVATEILKDLALMDVKVANYTFPTAYCAECGDKISKKKPRAKVKR